MPRDPAGVAARLDQLDAAYRDAGRPGVSDEQRRVVMTAFQHALPLTTDQRVFLLRVLRGSPRWDRLRASATRTTPT